MRNKLKLLLLALPIMMLAVCMPLKAQSSSSSGAAAAGSGGGGGTDIPVTANFLMAENDSGESGDNIDEGDNVPFDGSDVINGTAIGRDGDDAFELREVGCYLVTVVLHTDPDISEDEVTLRFRLDEDNFGPEFISQQNGATIVMQWIVCVDDPTVELQVRVTDGTLNLAPQDSATISIIKIS